MSDVPTNAGPPAEASEPQAADRRRTWAVVLAATAGLLLCGCASTVFLVLTGIIAEPITVIEGILRFMRDLAGG